MFSSELPRQSPPASGQESPGAPPPVRDPRKICRDTLVNRLNYLSFKEQPVTLLFIHRRHGRRVRVTAYPQPSSQERLSCCWAEVPSAALLKGEYILQHLELPLGRQTVRIGIETAELTERMLYGRLAEKGELMPARRAVRHPCRPLQVQVVQNGAVFTGMLDNFNGTALRMDLCATPPQNFLWLNAAAPVMLIVSDETGAVLTAEADVLRMSGERQQQTLVATPRLCDQRRLPGKKHRGPRLNFSPPPQVVFSHPFTGKQLSLDVNNVSGTGFAVHEPAAEAVLLPGLTLNTVQLRLTDTFTLHCKAQVVYCRTVLESSGEETRHSGLAILDMSIPDHTRLLALLQRAGSRRRGVSPPLDLDRLWEFFFASGFIYPEKYLSVHEHREEFLETCRQLYQGAPDIARHFVIQESGQILAHMAMLRVASNSWLIQHHAADHAHSNQAGLDVLQLAGEAINASQGLYSAHMDYALCFYRPENRFPHRVFGGVADHYRDRSLCSVDTFAYFHYRKGSSKPWPGGENWSLTQAKEEDLLDLEACYAQQGGGLMLKALDLGPRRPDQSELMASYRRAGFSYRQDLFALRCNGTLTAIFATMRTAVGMNLSNLTNAITALIINPEELPLQAFCAATSTLAAIYPVDEVPVLTYPADYLHPQRFSVEKHYNLWAIDCRRLDPYFDYCDALFHRLRPGRSAVP